MTFECHLNDFTITTLIKASFSSAAAISSKLISVTSISIIYFSFYFFSLYRNDGEVQINLSTSE